MGKVSLSFPPSSQKITFQLNPSVVLLVCLFVCLFFACLSFLPSRKTAQNSSSSFAAWRSVLFCLLVCLFILPSSQKTPQAFHLQPGAESCSAGCRHVCHLLLCQPQKQVYDRFFKIGRIIIVRIICFVFHRNRCANQNLWILCLK